MKGKRLAAGVLLAVMLAPGTFLRTQIPRGSDVDLSIRQVRDLPPADASGGFTREGVWELSSDRIDFGGYSALLILGENTLRLFSDRGNLLTFSPPGAPKQRAPRIAFMWNRGDLSATPPDIEAATRDRASGDYWLAFENSNAIIRYSIASEFVRSRRPPAWQAWPENSGAEAMARLPDGRFLVLPESASTGLLYPADPTNDDVTPLKFGFSAPEDYHPTDATALPDGRVLVLLRKVTWALPPFATAIAIANPTTLQDGDTLDLDLLVRLDDIVPRDNYEAMSVATVEDDGTVTLWLASDDNMASFQRTLLVRLSWREEDGAHEKAREE